jgi:hypothetical protein
MIHLRTHAAFDSKKEEWQTVNFGFVPPRLGLRTLWLFTVAISPVALSFQEEWIIKLFFRIIPKSVSNQMYASTSYAKTC